MGSFGEIRPTSRKYTRELRKIKPARTRVIIKKQRDIEKKHGKHTQAMAWHGNKFHTVMLSPSVSRMDIAHEFGHIALKHKPIEQRVWTYARDELAAWQWAVDNWQKPNRWVGLPRSEWVGTVVTQLMCDKNLSPDASLEVVKGQLKYLGLPPLSLSEEKGIMARARKWEKKLKSEGWRFKGE